MLGDCRWRRAGFVPFMDNGSRQLTSARLTELDSLRGIAALGIVVWHYIAHFNSNPLPFDPIDWHGYLLVDFFFILSGFVLARTYWTDERRHLLSRNIWERIARLYPLHLVMLLFVAVGQWLLSEPYIYSFNDRFHFALNLGLINYVGLQRGISFNGPSWSISTEFFVNIIFLTLILLPRRAVLVAAVILLAASAITFSASIGAAISRTVLGFFAGLMLHELSGISRTARTSFWDAAFVVAIVLYAIRAAMPENNAAHSFIMSSILFYTIILSAQAGGLSKAALRYRPLVFLGTISYSVYLVHFPLQLALKVLEARLGVSFPYENALFFLLFMALVVSCSAMTYYFIEAPGKGWLRSAFSKPVTIHKVV